MFLGVVIRVDAAERPFVARARSRQRAIDGCCDEHACYSSFMTEDSTMQALARIERALARIEAAAQRKPAPADGDSRYQALRTRTQAALASLENVIAQVEGRP